MRIALPYDGLTVPPRDGCSLRHYHLSRQLSQLGHDVHVILPDRALVQKDVVKSLGPSYHFVSPDTYWQKGSEMLAILRQIAPDVLQLNSIYEFHIFGWRAMRELNLPVVCEVHDVDSRQAAARGEPPEELHRLDFAQAVACQLATKVIAISSDDVGELTALGVPPKNVTVIPHGMELADIPPWSQRGMDIVFLGSLFHKPNEHAADLIVRDICPVLLRGLPECRVHIVGRTPEHWHTKVLPPNVVLHSFVPDLGPIFAKCRLAIAPLVTGSGMKTKMLDYLGYGLPVLATPLGAAGFANFEGVISVCDVEAFPASVVRILQDEEALERHSERAVAYVTNSKSWRTVATDVISCLAEAVDTHTSHGPCRIISDAAVDFVLRDIAVGPYALRSFDRPISFWLKSGAI